MQPAPEPDVSQTAALLVKVRGGNAQARDDLFARFQPRLAAYLHNRLPAHARGLDETQDLVQDICIKAFTALDRFEDRGVGTFWMFLRTAANHHLVDVVRKRRHELDKQPIPEDSNRAPVGSTASPLERAGRHEVAEAFERALATLPDRTARAVAMRLELDLEYATIAHECGFPSSDAARVAIARALTLVAREMKRHEPA